MVVARGERLLLSCVYCKLIVLLYPSGNNKADKHLSSWSLVCFVSPHIKAIYPSESCNTISRVVQSPIPLLHLLSTFIHHHISPITHHSSPSPHSTHHHSHVLHHHHPLRARPRVDIPHRPSPRRPRPLPTGILPLHPRRPDPTLRPLIHTRLHRIDKMHLPRRQVRGGCACVVRALPPLAPFLPPTLNPEKAYMTNA